jgi:hypothetical protein
VFDIRNKKVSSLATLALLFSLLFTFVDAKSVVERRHVINGLSFDVELLHNDRETEYYRDRFLIKGLPNNTSDEYLLCYIKAVTGMKPKFLAFHKNERDVVLVIMRCNLGIYLKNK